MLHLDVLLGGVEHLVCLTLQIADLSVFDIVLGRGVPDLVGDEVCIGLVVNEDLSLVFLGGIGALGEIGPDADAGLIDGF